MKRQLDDGESFQNEADKRTRGDDTQGDDSGANTFAAEASSGPRGHSKLLASCCATALTTFLSRFFLFICNYIYFLKCIYFKIITRITRNIIIIRNINEPCKMSK